MSRMRWCGGIALAVLAALPVLLLSPFPTQDGPSHLYAGHLIRHLGDAGYPAINAAFEYSNAAISTWTVHGIVAVLLGSVSPFWSEKIVVLGFLLPLFGLYAVGPKGSPYFPLCALPLFAVSFPLRMGFYSFCLSMPVALLAVVLWAGVSGLGRRLLPAAALLALLPLLHLLSTAWALALMGVASMVTIANTRRVDWRELAILAVAALPFLAILVSFPGSSGFVWEKAVVRLAALMAGGAIVGGGPYALVLSSAASLVLLVLALLFARGGPHAGDTSGSMLLRLALVAVSLAVALLVPEEGAGGAYIGVRYNLLFFLLLLFLFRGWRLPKSVDAGLSSLFLVLSVVHLASAHTMLSPASAAQREVAASAAALDDHTTLLVAVAGRWVESDVTLETQVRPILHVGDLLGVGADRVVLSFYEGEFPFFPVSFRKEASPFGALFDRSLFGWMAPDVEWDSLATWRGGVDYVGIWGEGFLLRSPEVAAELTRVLRRDYREVYRSADWPWVIYGHVRSGSARAD